MAAQLELSFSGSDRVTVVLFKGGRMQKAAEQSFKSPLDKAAQQDLYWYLEVYPAH